MKTAALIVGLVFILTGVSFGQARTITNSTLDKFKQKRLAAERDYRDNYERLGFPSPEELERQREADMSARLELAEQLRQARLEKERLELERRGQDLEAARLDAQAEANQFGGFYGGFFGTGGFDGFGSGRHRGRFGRDRFPFGFIRDRNRLLPMVDRRGAYRITPFGIVPVPNPRPIFRGRIIRGRHR